MAMILEPGVVAVDEVEDLHLGTMAPPVGAGLSRRFPTCHPGPGARRVVHACRIDTDMQFRRLQRR